MRPRALVTGGSRGIGLAIAKSLAETHDVLTVARGNVMERSQDHDCGRIEHLSGLDLNVLNEIDRLELAPIDVLVNNVGAAYDGLLATQSRESIETLIGTNLTSIIYLTKLYVRARLKARAPGVVISISSIVGIRGFSGLSVYSATKSALCGMTRALARELGPRGFRVNSVLPGYVETELSAGLSPDQLKQIVRRTPLGRLGTTEEIAEVVSFLASERARFITGQSIVVDGGLSA